MTDYSLPCQHGAFFPKTEKPPEPIKEPDQPPDRQDPEPVEETTRG
jgi:hypothetical protein